MEAGTKAIKFAVRFVSRLAGPLRALRADANEVVAEAATEVDLASVPLLDIHVPQDAEMVLTLPIETFRTLKRTARQRDVPLAVVVNTAVAYWLAGRRIIRLR